MVVFLVSILILGGLLLIYMFHEASLNHVKRHEWFFPDFPESFGMVNIFFISDVHKRKINASMINALKGSVDIVVIGGDLTEKGVPFERVKENLRILKELGPVYFVWGNNDYEVDYHELDSLFLDIGIKVLDNTATLFESHKGEKLNLLGIDDLNQNKDRLDLALFDSEKDSFKILVSHYPKVVEKIKDEHQISLVLSGHTHGGQIHLFGYSPYEKGGVKRLKNTVSFISNGYGTTLVPLRLGAPAECHLITLKRGPEKLD